MSLSSASAAVTPTWQNPYVEVIRYAFAHANVGWQQHGEVEQTTDREIHKNVFKIRGAIAANNYVRFPREVSKSNQGLGLTGRYVYVQVRRARGHHATLHLDLLTAKKSALRFSLSTMYSSLRSSGTVLRIPLDLSEQWTTIVIDMAEMLLLHGFNGYSRENYRYLKAVTCCAAMNVRNVFTSSTGFTPLSLPTNLALPALRENQSESRAWKALPADLGGRKPVSNHTDKPPGVEDGSRALGFGILERDEDTDDEMDEHHAHRNHVAVSPMPPLEKSLPSQPMAEAQTRETVEAVTSPPLSPTSRTAGLLRDREDVLSRADQIMREVGFSVPSPRRRVQHSEQPMSPATGNSSSQQAEKSTFSSRRYLASEHSGWPDPILSLDRVIGVSTAFPKSLRWIPDAPACVYTSYSTIILREFTSEGGMRQDHDLPPLLNRPQQQEHILPSSLASNRSDTILTDDQEVFLTGHTGKICAMTVSCDGALLASAQSTPQCVLRMWDLRKGKNECLIVMKAPSKSVHALAFSKDAATFCLVGSDDHARTQIFVWDANSLLATTDTSKKLTLRARQTCDFPIHAIVFSPYEPDQLVSCGRENVRFWRVNEARHHLPGLPVILKEYSRGTVFTDMAFDCVYPQFPSNLPRLRPVYVSSSEGSILMINYDTREVVCVYKLHDTAINSICVNEGFCVTGSDDKFLRVWPLDFSDFFLEAEHEAAVKCVDVSSDGMRIAVCSSSGAIGVLHLADQRYRTVLRSHIKSVHAIAPLVNDTFVTSSTDGTLRVWDALTGTQTMEFDVAKDMVTAIAAMPSDPSQAVTPLTIAVGFHSGCTRIFSLGGSPEALSEVTAAEPRVLHEFQQHQSSLSDLQYQSDAKILFTAAAGQQLCMYDVAKGYTPVKMLIADMDADYGKICLSRDRRFLAVIQQGRRSILLLDAASLCVVRVLTPPKATPSATPSVASDSHEAMQELTQLCISWNSQELLTLTRADRLHVFTLSEAQHGSRASFSFGSVIHSMPLLGQQGITSFALSPNLKYMATGGRDGSIRIWQCEFGKHKFQRMNQTFRLHAGQGAVLGLAFSCDGRRIIANSDSSDAVFVWRFRGNTSKLPSLELQDDASRGLRTDPESQHKAEFQLPLDDISNKNGPVSTSGEVETEEESPRPAKTALLKVSSRNIDIKWKRVLPAQSASSSQLVAWACGIGCLISTIGDERILVLERIESGEQCFLHLEHCAHRLVLSATRDQLAVLPTKEAFGTVCDLRRLRRTSNQTEGDDEHIGDDSSLTTTRVSLPRALDIILAAEFSVDGSLLCISGESSSHFELFVVDVRSEGDVAWHVSCSGASPVTSVFSQSPREFVCAAKDATRSLQRVRVPPFALSATSLTLEPAVDAALPTQPQLICFRDDGVDGDQQRCRFALAVDSEAYCYFIDIERQHKIQTMQLLLPSNRSTITAVQWVGTNEWQALIATINDSSIAVFTLPTQFAFTPSKTRVAAIDWAQLKRTGRLSSSVLLSFDGQRISNVLVDPLSATGIIITVDGAATVINFHTNKRQVLRAAPTLELCNIAPSSALDGAMLLTVSGDRRTLQCWEPVVGSELARLHVTNSVCTCVTVSPFDNHLVAAGYEDGSIRVFDVNEQLLVVQCVLPLIPQRGRSSLSANFSAAASPAEALSILKQRQMSRRTVLGSPTLGERTERGPKTLQFIGPRCVAVTTASSRVMLLDLSDVELKSASDLEATAVVAEASGKRSSAPKRKQKEKVIHFRELVLPTPDRNKRLTKTQRSALRISSAEWDVHVESIDVQLMNGRSPPKPRRQERQATANHDESALGSTRALLVLAKMADRARKGSVTVVHVFDGNEAPTSHPVHAEEDATPCDSWIYGGSGSPLFHPSSAFSVVYPVVDDEAKKWIEIRDFRARAVVMRLAVPAIEDIPREVCSLVRWQVRGKPVVVLAEESASAGCNAVAIVDLAKQTLVLLNCEGAALALPMTNAGNGSSPLLLSLARREGAAVSSGLVVAELVPAEVNRSN